jgi:2-polyprenyl-6-methoxyphenol hydroxylase-like FAD-dependent oxidoreductase
LEFIMQVIVVGGGIAGLTMALSLHQVGIAVRVYEAVRDLEPLGLGLHLQPAAVRELVELGIGDDLARAGIVTDELRFFNKFGQPIWQEKRGLSAGYKWPHYGIHRGQLQILLLRAVRARIGHENIRTGLRLVAFDQTRDLVAARFSGGNSATIISDCADVLIGADGIHSTVRRHLYPMEREPRFARQVLWRSVVDTEPFLGGHTMIIAGHYHQRIVAYPIARSPNPGRTLTNWICHTTVPDEHALPPEDWNRRVSKEKVLAAFGGWRFRWLEMPELIEKTPEIYEFPLVDRDPVEAWSCGRVTLVGDAAHPMYPISGQAGSQAIIDARVLTAALLATTDAVEALQSYDSARRPLVNGITLRNRQFGSEAALQIVEERAPNGFAAIEDVISQDELQAISASFSKAAGIDSETVNNRRPIVQPRTV